DEHLAVVVGTERLGVVECEGTYPAAMADERDLRLSREVPALDRVVLRAGEHESAARIEPAAEQRTGVPQFEDHARPRRRDLPGGRRCPGEDAGARRLAGED